MPTGYHGLKADSKPADWGKTAADFHQESDGRGEVLLIDGHPVMEQWEQPYMAALAKQACEKGGRVLEVGFGLGLSATAVQRSAAENGTPALSEHLIIEANENVVARGREWAAKQTGGPVTFLPGLWQDVVASLPDASLDGVLYDTYPLNKAEQHTHQFDFIERVRPKLKPGGILTFCNLTSIGVLKGEHKEWQTLWTETQEPHIERCGFEERSFGTFAIRAPDSCDYYAGHKEALVPRLVAP